MIRICMYCQQDQELTPYLYKASKSGVKFTHGICEFHFSETQLELGRSKKDILKDIQQVKSGGTTILPYLKNRPDLVRQYKKGIFTEPVV